MRWNAATGAIARCKATSIAYARKGRSAHAGRWTCGVKPKPKAVNKPPPNFIVHGLDKPGGFTTVSFFVNLKPRAAWRKGLTKPELVRQLEADLHEIPGVKYNFSQNIQDNVEEAMSGVK